MELAHILLLVAQGMISVAFPDARVTNTVFKVEEEPLPSNHLAKVETGKNPDITKALLVIANILKTNQRNDEMAERIALLEDKFVDIAQAASHYKNFFDQIHKDLPNFANNELLLSNLSSRMSMLELKSQQKFQLFETKLTFLAGEVIRLKNSKLEFSRGLFSKVDGSISLRNCLELSDSALERSEPCLMDISHERSDWQTSLKVCEEKGGSLASFTDLLNSTLIESDLEQESWVSMNTERVEEHNLRKSDSSYQQVEGYERIPLLTSQDNNTYDTIVVYEGDSDRSKHRFSKMLESGSIDLEPHELTTDNVVVKSMGDESRPKRSLQNAESSAAASLLDNIYNNIHLQIFSQAKPLETQTNISIEAMTSHPTPDQLNQVEEQRKTSKLFFDMLQSTEPRPKNPTPPNKSLDCPSLSCTGRHCVVIWRACADTLRFWCKMTS